MARIDKHPGDIFRIPLSGDRYGYAQWLPDGTACIFLVSSSESLSISQVCASEIAFRVVVFKDTPGRYGWAKVGRAEVPSEYSLPQRYAKKDRISGALSMYFEGIEVPASPEELRGLETAAVWAHPHIVERLEAQLAGRVSSFAQSIAFAT